MKKILVVEDSDTVRENLVDLLETNDYKVFSSDNGHEGYQLAYAELPDLIISDIMMPSMNGFQLLESLRNNPKTQNIPVIFLSAKSSMNEIREGMNSGVDDYITKPFDAKDVLQAVEVRLSKKDIMEAKFENTYRTISGYIPHELRTPLVSIIGFTNILIEEFDEISAHEAKDMLMKMKNASKRLHRTVEKFVLFNEAELMNSQTKKYDFFLSKRTEVQEILFDYLATEKQRTVELKHTLNIEPVHANIRIAAEHFDVIFGELIENAVKFSSPGKPIDISSIDEPEYLTIKIKNYGRGMTGEEIDNTAPFVQHNRPLLEQQGSGLGIIIVKKLCQFYGADFSINSVANVFTEVVVKFKKSCCSSAPIDIMAKSKNKSNEN
jgi:DNA-binding response OmpR family regulator/two-component sensor histidine kinase